MPSLKENNRYLLYDVIAEDKINENDTKKAILRKNLEFLGQLEYSKANIVMMNKNIIKVNSKYLNNVKTALMLIKEINNKKVIVGCKKVSGVLKKLK